MRKTIVFSLTFLPFAALAGVLILAPLPPVSAQLPTDSVTPVILGSPAYRWKELGTITASQSAPAVSARSYSSVTGLAVAKTFIWDLPNWGRKAQMSFQTDADADSTTIILLAFADPQMFDQYGNLSLGDDAVYGGQLVLTGGTQVGSHSNVYADTIVGTDGVFSFSVLDSATDRRCIVEFNTRGFKTIVGIATTLQASSTLYAYGRLFQ